MIRTAIAALFCFVASTPPTERDRIPNDMPWSVCVWAVVVPEWAIVEFLLLSEVRVTRK